MSVLDVYRDQERVGRIRRVDDLIEFEYAQEYLARDPVPISASLPLNPPQIRGALVANFFGNLLPEGDVRSALSQFYRLDDADDIGLLARIGAECAGALAIMPEGVRPLTEDEPFQDRYIRISGEEEFGQRIEAWATSPNAEFRGRRTKLSLAGAQSKTAIARFEGRDLYVSIEGAPTTHIIKFGSRLDNRGREVFPGIVYNEYYCSRLAHHCGIDILQVELLPYVMYRGGPQEHVFCIQRYDRNLVLNQYPDGRKHRILRLHQEDFCQALGRSRAQKYEATGGITLSEMFRFCSNPDQILIPVMSRRALLNLVLFNLLIGNRDSHAKNYSLIREGFKASLAPAYDLVCTEVYEGIDQSFPQRFGGAETLEGMDRSHIEAFAREINLAPSAVLKNLGAMMERMLLVLPTLSQEIGSQPFAARVQPLAQQINVIIKKNIGTLRRSLGL